MRPAVATLSITLFSLFSLLAYRWLEQLPAPSAPPPNAVDLVPSHEWPTPFLVFSAIGDPTLPRSFLDVDPSVAHVAVAYYGRNESRWAEIASDPRITRAFRSAGTKFQLLWALKATEPELVARYKWLAVFDDDLLLSASEITSMFRAIGVHGADHPASAVYSPAHDASATTTYYALRPQGCACRCSPSKGSCAGLPAEFRQVSFVEMGWPIFRKSFAEQFLGSYSPVVPGYGIDVWFSALARELGQDIFVVDSVVARNPQPHEKGLGQGDREETSEMRGGYPWRAKVFDLVRDGRGAVRVAGSKEEHGRMLDEAKKPGACCR
ncbi:hypothetical protein DFJ74DRAFT_743298 [Hyaloraphidium curvatum]|nr:hypothetical protein DFJ74DRAFT_743298 [Hyaloraphidium curvatum]